MTLPAWLRISLYIIAGIGTPTLALLMGYGIIDGRTLGLWSALVAAIQAIAVGHVQTGTTTSEVEPVEGTDGYTEDAGE